MVVAGNDNENKIGVLQASAYCLGDIIGAGIFVTPTSILKHSGSIGMTLAIWLVSALISGIAALVYVELGTSINKSGSDFAYVMHAQWTPVAVAFLYSTISFARPTILAIQTLAFGEYISQGLQQIFCINEEWLPILVRIIGLLALYFITFINLFSLSKSAARFQLIATASKLLVIAIVICTGIYYLIFKGGTAAFSDPFARSTTNPGDIVLGIYAGLYAYNGWDVLNYGTEEIRNPKRTLPIASLTGIALSALVFLMMNVSYFSVMSIEQFLRSDAVAVTFAEISLRGFSYLVPFLIGLLLLGNLNCSVFACSRILLAGANEKMAPSFTRTVHVDSMSPRAAVLVEAVITNIVLFLGGLDQLIGYMSFAMWMQRTFTIIALLYMRQQRWMFPKDAFRTPIIVPICALCLCLTLLTISVTNNPMIVLYGGSTMLLGLVVYGIFLKPSRLPSFLYNVNEKLVVATQIALNVMPLPEKNE